MKLIARILLALTLASVAPLASASLFSGDALDKVADIMAIVVLIVVPVVLIVVFWLVHVLPERVAEKRHHPQTAAITTLCLLSLVFGGLLWPLAWLWAYTRPVMYKAAYGTDKAETWHEEVGDEAKSGRLLEDDLAHLRSELDSMAAKGALPANLRRLREDLDKLQPAPAPATRATEGQA